MNDEYSWHNTIQLIIRYGHFGSNHSRGYTITLIFRMTKWKKKKIKTKKYKFKVKL